MTVILSIQDSLLNFYQAGWYWKPRDEVLKQYWCLAINVELGSGKFACEYWADKVTVYDKLPISPTLDSP